MTFTGPYRQAAIAEVLAGGPCRFGGHAAGSGGLGVARLRAAGFAAGSRRSARQAQSALLEYATAPRFRSLLVLEPRVEISEAGPGGYRVNLWISGLLEAGLTFMRTGGQMPDRYDGGCTQPGDWLEVVSEVGGCIVLIGTVGLYAVADDDMTTGRFRQMINQAARAGVLVGGLVETYWGTN